MVTSVVKPNKVSGARNMSNFLSVAFVKSIRETQEKTF